MKYHFIFLILPLLLGCAETRNQEPETRNEEQGTKNVLPLNPDSTVNALIEIPAGTNAKWEVDKSTGELIWEQKDGKPRVVQYLPYPANYGMIPGTLLPKAQGGDGDPLDILVLGPAVERGSIQKVQLIGVLKLLDGGEVDDKLIGLIPNSPFGHIRSLEELEAQFSGVAEIIQLWFHNYKGPGKMEALGFEGKKEAQQMLGYAITSYSRQ